VDESNPFAVAKGETHTYVGGTSIF